MIEIKLTAVLMYPSEARLSEHLGKTVAEYLKGIDGDGLLDVDDLDGGGLLAGVIVDAADSCEIEVEGFGSHR